ncbi:kinase-like domain-containing protein, partial [Mycena alexandri]
LASGGFGDIWRALVHEQKIAIKVMRTFLLTSFCRQSNLTICIQEFAREAMIWRQLSHPNVLPFFGLHCAESMPCLVSPWMENGNITQFLRIDQPNIDRLSLILDVALGLEYLHSQNVIHGDLKGPNILVTPSHRACLADFGLSSIIDVNKEITTAQATRYCAPELLQPEAKSHFGSDIYAFACVSYEIFTGQAPFHQVKDDAEVIWRVLKGERPPRPKASYETAALENVWELLQQCWDGTIENRPTAPQIAERLRASVRAKTPSSTSDWDDKFIAEFRRSFIPLLSPLVIKIQKWFSRNSW